MTRRGFRGAKDEGRSMVDGAWMAGRRLSQFFAAHASSREQHGRRGSFLTTRQQATGNRQPASDPPLAFLNTRQQGNKAAFPRPRHTGGPQPETRPRFQVSRADRVIRADDSDATMRRPRHALAAFPCAPARETRREPSAARMIRPRRAGTATATAATAATATGIATARRRKTGWDGWGGAGRGGAGARRGRGCCGAASATRCGASAVAGWRVRDVRRGAARRQKFM